MAMGYVGLQPIPRVCADRLLTSIHPTPHHRSVRLSTSSCTFSTAHCRPMAQSASTATRPSILLHPTLLLRVLSQHSGRLPISPTLRSARVSEYRSDERVNHINCQYRSGFDHSRLFASVPVLSDIITYVGKCYRSPSDQNVDLKIRSLGLLPLCRCHQCASKVFWKAHLMLLISPTRLGKRLSAWSMIACLASHAIDPQLHRRRPSRSLASRHIPYTV